MVEVTLQNMLDNLKQLYIKHDNLITEIKQTKEDIELLQYMIMHRSNKDGRVLK